MGNDGGSIPSRRELVQTRAALPTVAASKEVLAELQAHRWTTCPLSGQELTPPIVSDCLGTLYNKTSVLEYLLPCSDEDSVDKRRGENLFTEENGDRRVKSIKDVVEVRFSIAHQGKKTRFICPATGSELGPGTRSVYLVPCGHASKEEAIKEITDGVCSECNEAFEARDVISILATVDADLKKLWRRIEQLRAEGLTHSLKPAFGAGKKRKKAKVTDDPAQNKVEESTIYDPLECARGPRQPGSISSKMSPAPVEKRVKSRKSVVGIPTGGIKNLCSISMVDKIMAEEQLRKKKQKLTRNENVKSLFVPTGGGPAKGQKDIDFMNRGFALPTFNSN